MVSSENIYCYSNGFSLVGKVYFFILLLSRLFSSFLVFICLTMICFDVDFFGCILLRRVQLLKSIDLRLLPSLEHFSAIISSTFSAQPSFSSPSSPLITLIIDLIVPYVLVALFWFLSIFPLFSSDGIKSIVLSLSLLIFFSPFCCWDHPLNFLFQSLYFLVLKFPCWFFFISPVPLLRCFISSLQLFTFSFVSSCVHNCLLKCLYNGYFKIFATKYWFLSHLSADIYWWSLFIQVEIFLVLSIR